MKKIMKSVRCFSENQPPLQESQNNGSVNLMNRLEGREMKMTEVLQVRDFILFMP